MPTPKRTKTDNVINTIVNVDNPSDSASTSASTSVSLLTFASS